MMSFLLVLGISFSNLALGCSEIECSAYAPVTGHPTFYGCAATEQDAKDIARIKCELKFENCIVDSSCKRNNSAGLITGQDNIK